MTPSLNDGDLLLYYKYGKEYKSGDVVYVEKDKEKIVLRVIGKPGDVIDISEDGYLYVNNHVDNNYVFFETLKADDSDIEFPYKVKEDELFYLESKGLSESSATKLIKNGYLIGNLSINDEIKKEIIDLIEGE